MAIHALLVVVAVWTAWRPTETVPVTSALLAISILLLTPWTWKQTHSTAIRQWLMPLGLIVSQLVVVTASGWDRSRAVSELGLILAVAALIWVASRQVPPERWRTFLAFGVALLSLWAVWQVTIGFEQARAGLVDLPPAMRETAAIRLGLGRAFASLPLPGHLAVLLATCLPLLLPDWKGPGKQKVTVNVWLQWLGCGLCVTGLLLTRSLLGAGLAACACAALFIQASRRRAMVALTVMIAVVGLIVIMRSDLAELEPVRLRLDNWRTAVWVWYGSPISGVGLGGLGQASQAVPFPVGNRPVHAHSLPLELLAELGVVGLGLIIAGAIWLVRHFRRLWPEQPKLAVAIILIPLHNLADFSLFVSGVAVPWAVLLGWSLATVRPPSSGGEVEQPPRGRAFMVLATALAAAFAIAHCTSVLLERAAAGAGPVYRVAAASVAADMAPWRAPPIELTVVSALDRDDAGALATAQHALARGRWLRPRSANLASLEARLAIKQGRVADAVAATWEANHSQPASSEYEEALTDLLSLLEPQE
jgi:O-antigen ligase